MPENHIALNPFPLMLFGCGKDQSFAKKVAKHIDQKLQPVNFKEFSDKDFITHQENSVRDRNLFVICQPRKGDKKWKDVQRCMSLVYSLRQGSPKSWITVVMPYLSFARQDKPSNLREPVLAPIIPIQLKAVGADHLVVVKLHNPASRTVFPLIKMEDIDTTDLIVKYIKHKFTDLTNIMLGAPDIGASKSAREVAEQLGVEIVIVDKRRDPRSTNQADVMNIIGDPSGKDIIMIDDILDTGTTLCKGANALREKNARDIHGIFTHLVGSGNAFENLQTAGFKSLVFTNTLPIRESDRIAIEALGNCETLDVTKLVGQTIANLHNGESVDGLYKENGRAPAKAVLS